MIKEETGKYSIIDGILSKRDKVYERSYKSCRISGINIYSDISRKLLYKSELISQSRHINKFLL